ncbi:uncharacterized protein LAESUDRAFT_810760 [Laetiporus sulphureus 93-53]|uniref:Uncharacterized protein n=1 Tax=Laetiporus sulphureus 93-53 TaxID=1314785 RepID=A0A165FKG0_9APHY|nr:uncharacterized protein LAESUDRAFT_810760 [Laetiporus sulphureus 93-53]KZT09107.1 hypothetical protein LAESUDRAFT_810760 [Laetiporus sulphureus 93-53]
MATYYTPPARHQSSSTPSPSVRTVSEREQVDLPTIDLTFGDHSIYVFPNPSSAPPSPASTLFSGSVPTDFPSSYSPSSSLSPGSSRSRSHTRRRPRPRHHPSHHAIETQNLSLSTSARSPSPLSGSPCVVTDDSDPDVELWDWDGRSPSPLALDGDLDGTESWVLEEEIERHGRWGIALDTPSQQTRRTQPLHQAHSRMRLVPCSRSTLSRATTGSSLTGYSARARASMERAEKHTMQPRVRIPLLSLVSKLFALDLDEPALRLLTHVPPHAEDAESVLFPGHKVELAPASPTISEASLSTDSSSPDDTERDLELTPDLPPTLHGTHKLLLSAKEDATRALRAGLAISMDLPGLDFGVGYGYGFGPIAGLWRAVGEVCVRSGQAWREVWATS